MCLVALLYRVVPGAPVVVGANREEAYARGGNPPRLLEDPVPALAGTDPVAGGINFETTPPEMDVPVLGVYKLA